MSTAEKTEMGRITVEIELVNHEDVMAVKLGSLAQDKVRRLRLDAIVDTGAAQLVIPQTAADVLGVPIVGETTVRYADHRRDTRKLAGDVEVHVLGRDSVYRAIIEPGRQDALLGAIVLEDMDLIVDCRKQRLMPRDPNQILYEID